MEINVKEPPWVKLFEHSTTPYYGYVSNYTKAKEILQIFEVSTNTKFVCLISKKFSAAKKNDVPTLDGHFVRFFDANHRGRKLTHLIENECVPFICRGYEIMQCHRGKERKSHTFKGVDNSNQKKKRNVQQTKKQGCEARITIRGVVRFPEFKMDKYTEFKKKRCSRQLKEALQNSPELVKSEQRFYISLPELSEHNHDNTITEDYAQLLDKRLKNRIYELVSDGIDKATEIKDDLNEFLESNKQLWFPNRQFPSKSSKRYYPTNQTIRNHIFIALTRYRLSKIDPDNLERFLGMWKCDDPENSMFFRPYNKESNQPLLLVCQSKNQKYLLNRYGNEACLLDSVYKTVKFTLPYFFIIVKTNVDYQPVAMFVTMSETVTATTEALQIVKTWNPDWEPKYFLVDNCETEIRAIEGAFPNVDAYFCDFHNEQQWEKWLSINELRLYSYKAEILEKLKKISHSETDNEFLSSFAELKDSIIWKKSLKLQSYLKKTWEPYITKWVWCYRNKDFFINMETNCEIERLEGEIECFLGKYKDESLSSIVNLLYTEFFVEKFQEYVNKNTPCLDTLRSYSTTVPNFLHNRPHKFIVHCLQRMADSALIENVFCGENLEFSVQSKSNDELTRVKFAYDSGGMPSCECRDWKNHRWPCKHMFAVLRDHNHKWEEIGITYINSVFNVLDEAVILMSAHTTENTSTVECDDNWLASSDVMVEVPFTEKSHEDIKKSSVECRKMLNEMVNLTYIIEDELLLKMKSKVTEVHNWLTSNATLTNTSSRNIKKRTKRSISSGKDDQSSKRRKTTLTEEQRWSEDTSATAVLLKTLQQHHS